MPNRLSKNVVLWLLVGLLLLLTVLSMRHMRTASFWFDEIESLKYVGAPPFGEPTLAETITRVLAQNHPDSPPAYYLLLNVWRRIVGQSEFAGWMLPMLAGLTTVSCMYRLARDVSRQLGNRSSLLIGISATVVLAISAFFIQYLYELRVYIFVILFTITFLWSYWRLTQIPQPSRLLQICYVLSVALLLYAHYTTTIFLTAVGLYHLIFFRRIGNWRRITLLTILGGLFFVPWVVKMADQVSRARTIERFSLTPFDTLRIFLYTFGNASIALLLAMFAFATAVRTRFTTFVLFVLGLSLLIGIVLGRLLPVFQYVKYMIFLWPLAALLVGFAVSELPKRRINPAWVLIMWSGAGLWNHFNATWETTQHEPRAPWRELRAALSEQAQPNDLLLYHVPFVVWLEGPELDYYLYGLPLRHTITESIPGNFADNAYYNDAKAYIGNTERLWLGVNQAEPANFRLGEIQRILYADYTLCYKAFDLPAMRLELYTRKRVERPIKFGDAVQISQLAPLKPNADHTLPVTLAFTHGSTYTPDTYSAGIHIMDAQNNLVAQSDFGLPNEVDSCRQTTIPIQTLAAGTYSAQLVVYEWQTGKRLPVTGSTTESFELGTFAITDER